VIELSIIILERNRMTQFDTLELYPTNHCQFRCSGCYANGNSKEWSDEKAQNILNSNIFRRVSKEITISGGEPTLWEPLLDFLPVLRKQNTSVAITVMTNAKKLAKDEDYFHKFVKCCKDNTINVSFTWHNYNQSLVPTYILMKEELLRDIYVHPDTKKQSELEDFVNKASKEHTNTYWIPVFMKDEYKKIERNLVASLKNKLNVLSRRRLVDDVPNDNLDIIQKSSLGKFDYTQYDCKCGRNGIIFTNGRLYHCLSQALNNNNPQSLNNKNEVEWVKCNHTTCYNYNFPLQKSEIIS
jgi:organic radical activating enzyme